MAGLVERTSVEDTSPVEVDRGRASDQSYELTDLGERLRQRVELELEIQDPYRQRENERPYDLPLLILLVLGTSTVRRHRRSILTSLLGAIGGELTSGASSLWYCWGRDM